MKVELQEKLFKDHPDIFQQKDLPMSQTCMCWGIECGDGWYPIIKSLCLAIENIKYNYKGVHVFATQVKEKYGTLRFYYSMRLDDTFENEVDKGLGARHNRAEVAESKVDGAVRMAECLSSEICEVCGAWPTKQTRGWISTLCDKHYQEATQ